MAADPDITSSTVEVDEMLVRPGTYFNPQTEIVVIVDDSTSVDQEIFNMEAYEGSDWVRVSEDVPVDEDTLEIRRSRSSRPTITEAPPARFPRPRSSRATARTTRKRTASPRNPGRED